MVAVTGLGYIYLRTGRGLVDQRAVLHAVLVYRHAGVVTIPLIDGRVVGETVLIKQDFAVIRPLPDICAVRRAELIDFGR